jgi:hypothetical protein
MPPHDGQPDEGKTTDKFLGKLYIHTLRKEPITAPNMKTKV